jgi:hypothetical protein
VALKWAMIDLDCPKRKSAKREIDNKGIKKGGHQPPFSQNGFCPAAKSFYKDLR